MRVDTEGTHIQVLSVNTEHAQDDEESPRVQHGAARVSLELMVFTQPAGYRCFSQPLAWCIDPAHVGPVL